MIGLNVLLNIKGDNMIDEETFQEAYNNDPEALLKDLLDDWKDSLINIFDIEKDNVVNVSYYFHD